MATKCNNARAKTLTHSLVVTIAAITVCAAPVLANPVSKLPGRWTGWGKVTLVSGAVERVKCVATYFVKNKGVNVRQNLRCANSSYKIDTTADYTINGQTVTGNWEERVHANTGTVQGKLTSKGFNLAVSAQTFSATLTMTTGKCSQSLSFAPTNLDVTRISVGLRKC